MFGGGGQWLPAYITGSVDQDMLLRNEYLVKEYRIPRNQVPGRLRLTDGERKTLAEIGMKLGKKALEEIARESSDLSFIPTLTAETERVTLPESFRRGDANVDASVDLSDVVFVFVYLFAAGAEPSCLDAADANDDGRVDISDTTSLLGFL